MKKIAVDYITKYFDDGPLSPNQALMLRAMGATGDCLDVFAMFITDSGLPDPPPDPGYTGRRNQRESEWTKHCPGDEVSAEHLAEFKIKPQRGEN